MNRARTVILRMRRPVGALHYMQAYRNERIADVKSWLASVHGYPIEQMALRHGDRMVPDDMLASDLPTALIAICLLPNRRWRDRGRMFSKGITVVHVAKRKEITAMARSRSLFGIEEGAVAGTTTRKG